MTPGALNPNVMCITVNPLFWTETTLMEKGFGEIEPKVGIELAFESQ
jgi:hypothetical protein